jgi:hypothetical protein
MEAALTPHLIQKFKKLGWISPMPCKRYGHIERPDVPLRPVEKVRDPRGRKKGKKWKKEEWRSVMAKRDLARKPQDLKVMEALLEGKSVADAARAGGYSESYVHSSSTKIVARAKMLIREEDIKVESMEKKARARLNQILENEELEAKEVLPACRLALELAGMLGGAQSLHLHEHVQLPPAVMNMLTEKMREVMKKKEMPVLEASPSE